MADQGSRNSLMNLFGSRRKNNTDPANARELAAALIVRAEQLSADANVVPTSTFIPDAQAELDALQDAIKADDIVDIGSKSDLLAKALIRRRTAIEESQTPQVITPGPANHISGAFIIMTHLTHPEEVSEGEFNIAPKPNNPDPIPEEQRDIQQSIYGTIGVLKLLKQQSVFKESSSSYEEYQGRLLQVAEVGLTGTVARTLLAAKAVAQIRQEISMREGVTVKLKYLSRLALWAMGGAVLGALLQYYAQFPCPPYLDASGLLGYGWVIVGAMAGAWMSVAATRRSVAFEEIPEFLQSSFEPLLRLAFVGLLTASFALLIELNAAVLGTLGTLLNEFQIDPRVALLLGVFSGLSEKALAIRIVNRAQQVFSTSSS